MRGNRSNAYYCEFYFAALRDHVDAYLAIAINILREARRPLSAREILKRAYPAGKVPRHLHGRTQHKTLGARVAEDILEHGDKSAFFRNAPGRYFLTEFLNDISIPSAYRQRFMARRRKRQLAQPRPLTFKAADLPGHRGLEFIPIDTILDLLKKEIHYYPKSTKHLNSDDVAVWTFVIIFKDSKVLTYKHGQYREDRDTFHQKRAIGFFAPVIEGDRTLFDLQDHGIVQRGISTISIDLGINTSINLASKDKNIAFLECIVRYVDGSGAAVLSVIRFNAPDWFEPYTRRLAINDLCWIDIGTISENLEELDPWSAAIVKLSLRYPGDGIFRSG